jgi:murein DD-endopeptidase MepM/ murein hydrolase activator NlpD
VIVLVLVMPRGAAGAPGWRWPLRGPVVGGFRVTPHAPFARGQRRGIDVAARPGARVRAACPGRVTFAGPLPRRGLAVSVRCGALVATYLGLNRLAVRAGSRVPRGDVLGSLGASGRLRLGARRAADRRGYVDPLSLLSDASPAPPLLPAPAPTAAPATPPRRLPWPAYPGLALVASALPVGGLIHRRRRRARATAAAAVASRAQ